MSDEWIPSLSVIAPERQSRRVAVDEKCRDAFRARSAGAREDDERLG